VLQKRSNLKYTKLLNLYSVTYKYNIEILKEVHGTQQYNFDIEIINN
jgi:hypothetical protein